MGDCEREKDADADAETEADAEARTQETKITEPAAPGVSGAPPPINTAADTDVPGHDVLRNEEPPPAPAPM